MHDVVRDFAHWLTSSGESTFMVKSGLGMEEWPRSENFGCYTTISLMNNKINNLPIKWDCPKLETLLFSGSGSTRVPKTFFEGISTLKVLTVESVCRLEGLQFLTNLRALHLEKCKLNNISALRTLKKLEILDFHGSEINSLPNELGDLPSLRLLDLSDCQRLRRIPSNLLGRLSLLEELYFSGFSVQQWANEDEGKCLEAGNASLSELNSLSRLTALSLNVSSKYFPRDFAFSKLQRYGIFINRWNYGSYPTSRTLQIKGCKLEAFKELFCNVECLALNGIIGYKNLIPISDQGGLNKLSSLEIQDCKDFECLIDATEQQVPGIAFSNLVRLTILETVCLKELCNGQPPKRFLQKLEEMTVKKCKQMISVVPALQNLKEVRVKDCDKLQVVFQIDGNLFMKEGNPIQLLSRLIYLDLELLPELRSICKGSICHVSFQSLKALRIIDCNKLTFLVSVSLAQSLVHLEKLEISHCSRLEWIIKDIADDQGEIILQNSSQPSSLLCFPNLKTLGIADCSRLQYIFPISTTAQGLTSDQGNEIVLPRLQSLVLENLKNLGSFYAENCFVTLPCLEKLEVRRCPYLTHFTVRLEVTMQSQLKRLCLSKVGKGNRLCNTVNPHRRQKSQNLEFLAIGDCEEIFQLQGGCFLSCLEALRLEALSDLQIIWKGPTNVANLQNLVCLVLIDCQKLRHVFPPKLAQNLKQLSYLDIQECGELEQIVAKDQISCDLQPLCFPSLTEICIKKCRKLKSLFPVSVACHLPKLDCIIVEEVFELAQVFGHEDEADTTHEEIMLLPLRELLLSKLPNLISFSPMRHHFKFPFLGYLTVTDCPKMITTFTVDSELTVHTKAEECIAATVSSSDIDWNRHDCPRALPPFIEEY